MAQLGGNLDLCLREKRRIANHDTMPLNLATDASSSEGARAGARWNGAFDSCYHSFGYRVGGVLVQGGGVTMGAIDVLSFGRKRRDESHLPAGDSTSFIKDHSINATGRLQSFWPLNEDAQLTTSANPNHEGSRRR